MKRPALLFLLGSACCWAALGLSTAAAQEAFVSVRPPATGVAGIVSRIASAPYNDAILGQIRTMPQAGGYSASHEATQRLIGAMQFTSAAGFYIDAARAQPSYCSGATYLVFMKTIGALTHDGTLALDNRASSALLINGQRDGEGVWGRWNANGPGTARLFYEMNLGPNFSDLTLARPGDFMKIFWSTAVGRREHGHSVIFLGTDNVKGVETLRFWSSNIGVGYSDKSVPLAKVGGMVFSRLVNPQNLTRAATLSPATDPYLASLLTKDSSLAEVQSRCGM